MTEKNNKPRVLIYDILPYYRLHVFEDGSVKIFSDSPKMKGKEMSQFLCGEKSYLKVAVRPQARLIHSLVAEAALGPRPEGLVINHKDGVKHNNHPNNLEYCTIAENIQHSIDMGLHVANRPEDNGNYKHGRALKAMLSKYKNDWFHANKERLKREGKGQFKIKGN